MNKEERAKPYFLRRVIAYLIDLILVVMLASAISLFFVDKNKTQGYTEELMDLTQKYTNKEISQEEFSKQSNDLNYYMSKENVDVTIINCSVALVYYVVLCYFCHGITLGKYIMKLRIVSANDKELNMGHYLLRALFVNLILSNIVSIVCVYTMNKDTFISVYPKLSNALTIFLLVTILFIMYRNDGRGLHDLMSNTHVISTKEPKVKPQEQEEVVEAKVIEEKKTTKKNTNKKKEAKKK